MKRFIYYSLLTVTVVIVLYLVAAAIYVPFNPAYHETGGLPTSAPISAFSAIRLLLVGPVCFLSGHHAVSGLRRSKGLLRWNMWWVFHSIAYAVCLIAAAAFILPNLYWAVRAPWKPKNPEEKRPPRSRITSKYLFRAALAAFLITLVLINI